MAVESTSADGKTRDLTPLPPVDPDLIHAVHTGPNLDRFWHLRPEDLLKRVKTKRER